MKKLLSLVLVLVLVCTLFAGCHGKKLVVSQDDTTSDGPNTNYQIPENFDTSRDYEISFWTKNDTNMTQVEIYKKAIADFEALYPNIKVNLRLYTDYGKIYNDVITNIATDTTPNVCITYPDHIATYLTGKDTVVPLDELMAHPMYGLGGSELLFDGPNQNEIIPQFLNECAFGGYYYAVPYMRSTECCYINKTFVEKLGYDLSEDDCAKVYEEFVRIIAKRGKISAQELIEAQKNGTLEECWGTGTAAVISPVGKLRYVDEVMNINGGNIGQLSQKLYDTITGIQTGVLEDPRGWRVTV